jgi:hypothetical protein
MTDTQIRSIPNGLNVDSTFDIFKRLPDGNFSCIGTVRGLAAVRGQINHLAEQNTGRYLIHSQGLIFDTPHSLLASC